MKFNPSLLTTLIAACARTSARRIYHAHALNRKFNKAEVSQMKEWITDPFIIKRLEDQEESAPADATSEDAPEEEETGRRDKRDRALITCADKPAWHPLYNQGWSGGSCGYGVNCNAPSFATELACCKTAYAGQESGFCLSQLPNPPTSAPTDEGGLDVYYPDWTRPFPEGFCINDRPAPPPGSRPFFETMLECCKATYAGQMSGKCLSMLPNPPTGAPTGSGGLNVWYAVVSLPYANGFCSNERPLPVYGVLTYDSQLECCKRHYGDQFSGKCLSMLPNPPTPSLTGAGGLDVYYPDYSRPFPSGVCINRAPLPNGRITYPTKEQCCAGAYAGQSSSACACDARPVFGCPGVLRFASRTLTGTLPLTGFDVPTGPAERRALVPVLEAAVEAAVLERMGVAVEVTVVEIGGVPVRRGLRSDAGRRLNASSFVYSLLYEHGYEAGDVDFEAAADAVKDAIENMVESPVFLETALDLLSNLPGNPLNQFVETDVVIVGAGAAGMSAAATISEETDYSITILEATDRVGGRIRTGTLGSTKIELAAEEHYLSNKANEALRNEYGDEIFHPGFGVGEYIWLLDDDKICYQGNTYQGNTSSTLGDCNDDADFISYNMIWDTYWKKTWRNTPYDVSLKDRLATLRLSGYPTPESPTYHLYENNFAGEYGSSTEYLGAKGLAVSAFFWPLGDTLSVIRDPEVGYEDGMYNALWKYTLADDSVTLKKESPVTNIDSSDSRFVKVTDLNGKIYKAQHVIVTASIAVLQSTKISFTPALPADTANAIQDIGMDPGMKIFMKFDKDWWTEPAGGPVATMIMKGSSGWCWPSYKYGNIDYIITCFIMSQNDELIKEGTNGDDGIIARALSDLDALFPSQEGGKLATRHYSGIRKVMDWGEEEYFQGAYSYPTVKTFKGNDGKSPFNGNARVVLQQPIANGRVLFAGEGTSVVLSATVPGAVDEGERAAWKVIRANAPTHTPTTPIPTTETAAPVAPIPTYGPSTYYPTTYPPTTS